MEADVLTVGEKKTQIWKWRKGGLATDSPSPGCDTLQQPPKAGARARGCSHTGLSLPEPAGGGSSHVEGADGNPKTGRQETDPEVTTNASCG